jgi:hypothetical protein
MTFEPGVGEQIITALAAHGVKQCPRCDSNAWVLVDGFLHHSISNRSGSVVLGGPTIPTIAVICKNCGFISQHSAIILGIEPFSSALSASKDAHEVGLGPDASKDEA